MNKINLNFNKTLKLTNAIIAETQELNFENLDLVIERMENFIKARGFTPIGPLIQYSETKLDENGKLDIVIKFIRQSNGFINHTEPSYKCVPILRIKNCMYVRYTGPESSLKFAYDKINLVAFEEGIKLKGDSYTVFVNRIDDDIIADVFMERAENE